MLSHPYGEGCPARSCRFMSSLGCSCGWMCFGLNALGSHTRLVQGEWPQQDAVQHQQLPQRKHSREKVLQGVDFSGSHPFLCFVVLLFWACHPDLFSKDPLLKGQRCVIMADGFYEWRRVDKEKQPFFIYFPQKNDPNQEWKEERQQDVTSSTCNTVMSEKGEISHDLAEVCIIFCWNKNTSNYLSV